MKKLRRRLTDSAGTVWYRFFLYDNALTCAQALAAYDALSAQQKAALPTTDPDATGGTSWQVFDCNDAGIPTDTVDLAGASTQDFFTSNSGI